MRIPGGILIPDPPESADNSGCGCVVAFAIIAGLVAMFVQWATGTWRHATFTVAPSSQTFVHDVVLEGAAHCSININKKAASITLDKIARATGGHSGSLRVILWATDRRYDGGTLSGFAIASWDLDELEAGWYYHDIHKTGDFTSDAILERERPYYITLTLNEYDGEHRSIVDWINFKEAYVAPPKTPWWKFWVGSPAEDVSLSFDPLAPSEPVNPIPSPSPRPTDPQPVVAPPLKTPESTAAQAATAAPDVPNSSPAPTSTSPTESPVRLRPTRETRALLVNAAVRIVWAGSDGAEARRVESRLRRVGVEVSFESPKVYRAPRSAGIYAPHERMATAALVAHELAAIRPLEVYRQDTRDGAIEIVLVDSPRS